MTGVLGRVAGLPQTIYRVGYKLTVARRRYGRGEGYDAAGYWGDRFRRYGTSLRGPGHEGMSEAENRQMYEQAGRDFTNFCVEHGVAFVGRRVLEIGCGTGFFTDLIWKMGPPREFVGVDVTDVQFEGIRTRHPEAKLRRGDITTRLDDLGQFDVVVMIDVVQHIVSQSGFDGMIENIRRALAPGAAFLVSPVADSARKEFFYVRWWPPKAFRDALPGFDFVANTEFRGMRLFLIESPLTGDSVEDSGK